MIRFFGVLLVAGGFFALGLCGAWRLKRRGSELKELVVGLETVKRELKYCLAPLPDLFGYAAEQTAGEVALLFSCCAERAGAMDGHTFCYIWKQALKERHFCLERVDFMILEQLGGVLGRYDADEQLRALECTAARLEEQCRQADERSGRLGRVYTVLGLAAGTFTIIFLI